jgi:hypothetical protein
MKRLLLATALLGSAIASTAAAPVSASAAAPAVVTASDGVLFRTCVHHPMTYATSPGSNNWSLFVSSERSNGAAGPFVSLSSALGDQPSGTTTLDFCGYGDTGSVYFPGSYTLTGELSWVDGGGVTHVEKLPPVTFTMAKPRTRTTLALSDRTPRPGQPIRFRVSVKVQSPKGWMRLPDDVLPLSVRVLARGPGEKKFKPIRGAVGGYDFGGTWSRQFRWLGTVPRAQFEAHTRGNHLVAESTSKVVRLTTANRGPSR